MSQGFKSWWHEIRVRERRDARLDPERPERIAMCAARKREMLDQAIKAGVLVSEEAPLQPLGPLVRDAIAMIEWTINEFQENVERKVQTHGRTSISH
jgi:hypothetical protein